MIRIFLFGSLFILLLSFDTPTFAAGVECPSGYLAQGVVLRIPHLGKDITFPCKHEFRVEYLLQKEQEGETWRALIWSDEDQGKILQRLTMTFANSKRRLVYNYDRNRSLEKEERFNEEGLLIYRFILEQSKLEELNSDQQVIRTCSFNEEEGSALEEDSRYPSVGKILIRWKPFTVGSETLTYGIITISRSVDQGNAKLADKIFFQSNDFEENMAKRPEGYVQVNTKDVKNICRQKLMGKSLFGIFRFQNETLQIGNLPLANFVSLGNIKLDSFLNNLRTQLKEGLEQPLPENAPADAAPPTLERGESTDRNPSSITKSKKQKK